MTNTETAAEIRRWCANPGGLWSWPTDPCGYDQHIAFVRHRNRYWTEARKQQQTFEQFCLEYAAALEGQPVALPVGSDE